MGIGFIGLGNMARAIIGGMLEQGIVSAQDICGSAKTRKTLDAVHREYGIEVNSSNAAVAAQSQTLVLAVKPQFLEEVIREIRDAVRPDTLIISIAAGKSLNWLEEAFGGKRKLVRCMPNTPALVGEGCTGVCVNDGVELPYETGVISIFPVGVPHEVIAGDDGLCLFAKFMPALC